MNLLYVSLKQNARIKCTILRRKIIMYKITLSIIFLLAITQNAFAQMTDALVNGKVIQAVKAGSMIEPVTYKITDLNRVSDALFRSTPLATNTKFRLPHTEITSQKPEKLQSV